MATKTKTMSMIETAIEHVRAIRSNVDDFYEHGDHAKFSERQKAMWSVICADNAMHGVVLAVMRGDFDDARDIANATRKN